MSRPIHHWLLISILVFKGQAINICPTREITASSGQIRSPSYPNNYPSNTDCTLTIKQPLDTNFTFTFTKLDIEGDVDGGVELSCYDFLRISGSLSKEFCATITPAPFVPGLNVVTLRMATDSSVEQSGFDLKFTTIRTTGLPPAVSVCPTRSIIPSAIGRVHSPGYAGNYGAKLNCKLTLNVPSNKDVEISYNHVDIEYASQCSKDKLTVADNSAFNHTCGASSAGSPTTYRDGNVSFLFSTDGSGSGSGFILSYKLSNKFITTSAGQTTQPSSTTESTTQPSSTTEEIIQPFSTTKSATLPSSTTEGATQLSSTTESTTLPSTTTDGTTQLSSTTEGTTPPFSTTDGTTQPSSTTGCTTQPSSTTENSRPTKCLCDNETSEKSSEDKKIHMDLLIPLVVLAICFLLSLAVIIYQSRRHQNSYRMASHKEPTGQESSNYIIMKGNSEVGGD